MEDNHILLNLLLMYINRIKIESIIKILYSLMKAKSFLIILALLFVSTSQLSSQIAKYQAVYIYNFLSNVQWPKEYRSGDIIIGVLGEKDKVVEELKIVTSSKKVGSRYIVVKPYANLGQFSKCHVLFIPPIQSAKLKLAVTKIGAKSTLLISSTAKGIELGADINFTSVNNKLGFEIKPTNASKKKIIIGSSLKRLAAKVY